MPFMPSVTIIVGVILIGYGAMSYIEAVKKSPTALIPAFFGAGFLICGLLAIKSTIRKHAMHLAAVVGLVGFLGGAAMGFPKLPALISGAIAEGKSPEDAQSAINAARSQVLLATVSLIFVILCVNSFIQARRARAAGNASPQ